MEISEGPGENQKLEMSKKLIKVAEMKRPERCKKQVEETVAVATKVVKGFKEKVINIVRCGSEFQSDQDRNFPLHFRVSVLVVALKEHCGKLQEHKGDIQHAKGTRDHHREPFTESRRKTQRCERWMCEGEARKDRHVRGHEFPTVMRHMFTNTVYVTPSLCLGCVVTEEEEAVVHISVQRPTLMSALTEACSRPGWEIQ